jgi:hypothetical protein
MQNSMCFIAGIYERACGNASVVPDLEQSSARKPTDRLRARVSEFRLRN